MRRPVAAALLVIAVACGGAPLPDEPRGRAGTSAKAKGGKHGSEAVREAEDPDAVARGGKKSADADDLAVDQIDVEGPRLLGQTGHADDRAAQRDDEAGAGG
jgi:hypothetical protein